MKLKIKNPFSKCIKPKVREGSGDVASSSQRAGASQAAQASPQGLGGRPPQASGSTSGARPRASISQLQQATPRPSQGEAGPSSPHRHVPLSTYLAGMRAAEVQGQQERARFQARNHAAVVAQLEAELDTPTPSHGEAGPSAPRRHVTLATHLAGMHAAEAQEQQERARLQADSHAAAVAQLEAELEAEVVAEQQTPIDDEPILDPRTLREQRAAAAVAEFDARQAAQAEPILDPRTQREQWAAAAVAEFDARQAAQDDEPILDPRTQREQWAAAAVAEFDARLAAQGQQAAEATDVPETAADIALAGAEDDEVFFDANGPDEAEAAGQDVPSPPREVRINIASSSSSESDEDRPVGAAGGTAARRGQVEIEEVLSPEVWSDIPLTPRGSQRGTPGRESTGSRTRNEPPPESSWRATVAAMLSSLAGGATAVRDTASSAIGAGIQRATDTASAAARRAGGAAATVGGELRQQGAALSLPLPSARGLGAVAGHLVHQSAAVGVPTFLREMMAEAMMLSLRHMPPHHALALQVAAGTASIGAQFMRRSREARDPDAAARGFHALTTRQWNALPTETKAKLRSEQDLHSRMLTNVQVVASMTHVGIGLYAVASKDKALAEMPANLFVGGIKAMVYAVMRDSVQASFNMVNTAAKTRGLSGPHVVASAAAYTAAATAGNFAFSSLPPLVPNASLATSVLRGESSAMSRSEAWQARAGVAAVKAAINTAVQTFDWSFLMQQEANKFGTVQRWEPRMKFRATETCDYSRLLDHSVARASAIAGGNATADVIGLAMGNLPEWASTTTVNLLVGAYEGLLYKTLGNTWQAQGAVRNAVAGGEETEDDADSDSGHSSGAGPQQRGQI